MIIVNDRGERVIDDGMAHGRAGDTIARLTSELVAANQQIDAMRAELAEAKAFVDFTRLHVCNAKGHTFIRYTSQTECPFCERDKLRAELENLRHNTTWTVDWEMQRARANKAEAERDALIAAVNVVARERDDLRSCDGCEKPAAYRFCDDCLASHSLDTIEQWKVAHARDESELAARTAERDRLVKETWELGTRADEADEALAALRQSPEADASPVACNRPCVSSSSLCAMPRNHYGYCSPLCPAPVAPVAAPSPSARAEEPYAEKDYPALRAAASKAVDAIDNAGLPGTWVVHVTRDHGGVLFRDGDWIAKNAVVKFDHDFAPPAQAAEIARLMMEKERKQHVLEEQLAEIAKLKALVDGTRREKIVTGRIVRLGRVSYLEKVGESPSRFGINTDRARAHRFLNDVRFVRLVRKPASGGGT